jgi:cytochrome c553
MRCQFDMLSRDRLDRAKVGSSRAVLAALVVVSSMVAFSPAIAADPVPAKKVVDLAKGRATAAAVCAACHMPDGNSMIPQNPKLNGQHAAYLEKQLLNFKMKPGAKEPERNNAIMMGFAAMLSDEDIRNISAFYASQKATPGAAKRADLVATGERIYRAGLPAKGVPACIGCHAPNGAGIPAQYPLLAGQHPEYTEAQLNVFRLGTRKNSAQMMTISSKMSEAEIAAVSEYVATLK